MTLFAGITTVAIEMTLLIFIVASIITIVIVLVGIWAARDAAPGCLKCGATLPPDSYGKRHCKNCEP